jgi:hypothetical protein
MKIPPTQSPFAAVSHHTAHFLHLLSLPLECFEINFSFAGAKITFILS